MKRINVYIADDAVLDYLDRQDNRSKYISRLIRDDMKGGHLTRAEVIRLIEQHDKPSGGLRDTINNMFK
jgi:predicted transcriptional regulator